MGAGEAMTVHIVNHGRGLCGFDPRQSLEWLAGEEEYVEVSFPYDPVEVFNRIMGVVTCPGCLVVLGVETSPAATRTKS